MQWEWKFLFLQNALFPQNVTFPHGLHGCDYFGRQGTKVALEKVSLFAWYGIKSIVTS
jgi:hypothetical protein